MAMTHSYRQTGKANLFICVGVENLFLYPLRYINWVLQVKRSKDRVAGEKAYVSVLILIFLRAWVPQSKEAKTQRGC